jgi:hypothetical protein
MKQIYKHALDDLTERNAPGFDYNPFERVSAMLNKHPVNS